MKLTYWVKCKEFALLVLTCNDRVSFFHQFFWVKEKLLHKSVLRQCIIFCDSLGYITVIGDGSGDNASGLESTWVKWKENWRAVSARALFPLIFRVGILLLWTLTSCPKSKPLARPSLWNHKCRMKVVLDQGRRRLVNGWEQDSKYTQEMLQETAVRI